MTTGGELSVERWWQTTTSDPLRPNRFDVVGGVGRGGMVAGSARHHRGADPATDRANDRHVVHRGFPAGVLHRATRGGLPKWVRAGQGLGAGDAVTVTAEPRRLRRRGRRIQAAAAAGLAVALLLTGCSNTGTDDTDPVAPAAVTTSSSFDFLGGLVLKQTGLTPDAACSGKGGYADITGGTPVTIYNAAGAVVAVGALDDGVAGTKGCVFPFTVPGVPAGAGFYSFEISHRGKVTVSEANARGGGNVVTLGG